MYIPINIKTEYDLMNSLIKIDELISYAKENNINTLGITDSNMFGCYEFIKSCEKNDIKPIIGIEINIDEKNILLYALNYDGVKELFNIVSYKNLNNLEYDYIIEHSNNLICVCEYKDYDCYKDDFEYVFIGYTNKNEKTNALLVSKDIVFIPKICYFHEEDYEYYKYIKYIKYGKTIDEEINVEKYPFLNIKTKDEIENTKKFCSLIDIKLPNIERHIPKYNDDSNKFLKALAKKGLEKRLNGVVPDEYKSRLTYELSVIEKMDYVDYFLIVYDYVLYAKKNNIMVGPGRGSGVASLVNYSLGIIDIDPLKYNLIFERFLNPDRITMPDIDIDFEDEKIDQVIEYVIDKYGRDNTARIISFNTMAPKQVIKDVSKVLQYDNTLIDRLCKTIKFDEHNFNDLKNNYEFNTIVNRNNSLTKLINICDKLCGLKKNTSITAAGVVISNINLSELMPLYKSNDTVLTGYSKEFIEDLGLLKMDFLSLKNLSTLASIVNDMKHDGIDIDINSISLDDEKTLDLFKKAYTTGIFQFEKPGMKSFLKSLQPNNLDTIIDALALYRPGPMEMIDEYIQRKNGKKKIVYEIPELEKISSSTYGIIIYQEQVLEILRVVGGYTYAEADNIRRAMSKKKLELVENNREKFTNAVINKGYSEKIANDLFNKIVRFAGYGFNKSHSVAYCHLSYKLAYLKANYPAYFMKNLLNNSKNSDSLKEYIDEAKYLGIDFEPLNINKSTYDFISDNNKLVMPLSLIKSISINICNFIVEERDKEPFKDFYDFMIRCYGQLVNKKVVTSLIECGAFDIFNINRKQNVLNIDEIINYVSLCKNLSLIIEEKPVLESVEDFDEKEIIDNEIKNYGFYLSFHPVTKYDRSNAVTINDFKKYFDKVITMILYVENTKTIRTKTGEKMSFLTLSDEYGSLDGIVFPEKYKSIGEIEKNNCYVIYGKVERRNDTYQLIINTIKNI